MDSYNLCAPGRTVLLPGCVFCSSSLKSKHWNRSGECHSLSQSVTVCHSLSQSVTVCHSLSQSVTVCHSLSQSVTVCHSLSQCLNTTWEFVTWGSDTWDVLNLLAPPREEGERTFVVDVACLCGQTVAYTSRFLSLTNSKKNVACNSKKGPMSMATSMFFPECVARVPVSLWGCGGRAVFAARCVYVRNRPQPSATVRNRSQPSATVRNRSQVSAWGPYGRVNRKFCKRGYFWSFPASRSFISRGRRGTLWHFNMFHDMSKFLVVWQAQYFCHVFKRCVAFFVAGAALWTPLITFCVAGAAL